MAVPNGIYAPVLTPVTADHEIDSSMLIEHSNYLLDNGVTGLAFLGTTGEANSFSHKQKMELVDVVNASGLPLDRCMVGTGCASIKETIEMTSYAVDKGLTHSLMLPPFYYKIVTDKGLFDYFSLVIDSVNDGRLQIYMYHFPKMSTVPLSATLIKQLVEKYPNTIVGMKDSTGDFDSTKSYLDALPTSFQVFPGTENLLTKTLPLGGAGCISATVNVSSKEISDAYAKYQRGESIEEEQQKIIKRRNAFAGLSYPGALKGYLRSVQNNDRWSHVMPPNELISEEVLAEVIGKM